MGFSAGGHLAAECATTNFGVVKDGLPAPSAMLLCYPAIDVTLIGGNGLADRMIKSLTIQNDRLEKYCVNLHLHNNYPPSHEAIDFYHRYEEDIALLAEMVP